MEIIQKSTMQELAKEVCKIEADSIMKLQDRIGENLDKALDVIISSKGRSCHWIQCYSLNLKYSQSLFSMNEGFS